MTKEIMTWDLRRAYSKEINKVAKKHHWRNFGSDSFGYEQERDGILWILVSEENLESILGMFSGDEDIDWKRSTISKGFYIVNVTFEK